MGPEKPKLIVTGMSGLIGSRLGYLCSGDYDLINLDIAEGIDLTDRQQVMDSVAAHADALGVIHLAAFTDVSAAYEQDGDKESLCYRVNVVGTQNIAEASAANNLHLVHLSTDFVFDGAKQEPYTEEDAPNPIEWYGRTKLMAEKAAATAKSWTVLRIAFPYVAGRASRADLVAKFRKALAEGRDLNLFDDQVVTPTFADDIVRGALLASRKKPTGETFHLTGSTFLSPYELGVAIANVFGFDSARIHPSSMTEYLKQDPRPRQRFLKISNAKWSVFARRHGISAPLGAQQGLELVRKD